MNIISRLNSNILLKCFLFVTLLTSCSSPTENYSEDSYDLEYDFLSGMFKLAEIKQRRILLENTNVDLFPEFIDKGGNIHYARSQDWTSGFYPGIHWILYSATGHNIWKSSAEAWTESLFNCRYIKSTHDLGFMILPSLYQGFEITKLDTYKLSTIEAASSLLTRFNKDIKLIKSWDGTRWKFPVIIDSMVNMELLFVASILSKDSEYSHAAIDHIGNITKSHLRRNGSVRHVVDFDTQTGKIIEVSGGQGLSPSSTWSRGQAWSILGYALAYKYTDDTQYVTRFEQVLSFYIDNLPEDGMPLWDFEASDHAVSNKDSSAGFITIYALLEMSESMNQSERGVEFRSMAFALLKKAFNNGYISINENYKGLTQHSIGNKPKSKQLNVTLLYADYYLLKSLLIIKRKFSGEFNKYISS